MSLTEEADNIITVADMDEYYECNLIENLFKRNFTIERRKQY
jgi:hypothetical protein